MGKLALVLGLRQWYDLLAALARLECQWRLAALGCSHRWTKSG